MIPNGITCLFALLLAALVAAIITVVTLAAHWIS